MSDTKRASLDDLHAMRQRGELARTLDSAVGIDLPEGFWDDAEIQEPVTKTPVNLRVDPDILDFFKAQGKGHLTRMHAVLRSYVDAQKKRSG